MSSPPALQFDAHFAFSGELGNVLKDCLHEDAGNWRLSWKFRCYYALRPWIPLFARHALQQSRNAQMPVNDHWYVHSKFLQRWRDALAGARSEAVQATVIHPWPDGYSHAAVLTHDIETRAGVQHVERLARLEESLGFRSAWYFVPAKYRIDPGLIKDLQARGHEVGVHGHNHDGQLFFSRDCFERRARKINAVAQQWNASGFRAPMMHRELGWMQALETDYDASCFDIDPYQAMPGGVGGVWPFIVGRLVELPCTLPQDHTLFVTLGQRSIDIWKRKYALLRRLRGMAMCIVHPDYLDTGQGWSRYQELLEEFAQATEAWKCLPHEVATWWRQRHASRATPSGVEGPAAPRGRCIELAELFDEFLAAP